MGRRGPKPRRAVNPQWTAELAYVCGLMASDGHLSVDGRHLNFTSKDLDLAESVKYQLGLKNRIGTKLSGSSDKLYYNLQWGDITFYKWLISIGITPRKSLTIKQVAVPDKLFADFLRGEFDGDGNSQAYWDARWRSSVSFYIVFTSASYPYLEWLNETSTRLYGVTGRIRLGTRAYHLDFSKKRAKIIYHAMYYSKNIPFLKRKKEKLDRQWVAMNMANRGQFPAELIRGGSVLKVA